MFGRVLNRRRANFDIGLEVETFARVVYCRGGTVVGIAQRVLDQGFEDKCGRSCTSDSQLKPSQPNAYATPRASLLDDAARESFLDAATTIRNYTTPGGRHGIDAMQNGRFARNVVERAEGFRDTRVVAQKRGGKPVTVEDLQIITAADIEAAVRSVCSDNRDMAAIVW